MFSFFSGALFGHQTNRNVTDSGTEADLLELQLAQAALTRCMIAFYSRQIGRVPLASCKRGLPRTAFSLLIPSLFLLIIEATPLEDTSGAAGMAFTFVNLGECIGSQMVLGIIMGKQTTPGSVGDYQTAFIWLAFATALMIPVLWSRNATKLRRSFERG